MKKLIAKLPTYDRIILGRNASYWRSVGLGLASIWWFPASLAPAVVPPLKLILTGLIQLGVSTAAWALARIIVIVSALCGFVVAVETQEAPAERT